MTDEGTAVSPEGARFRVSQDQVETVLTSSNYVEKKLSEPEKQLRAMVLARMISVDDFKQRIAELRPELSSLLDTLKRTDALSFPMQPVGFVLSQHEMESRTPQLAILIDAVFEDES